MFNHPSVWEAPDEFRPVGVCAFIASMSYRGILLNLCTWTGLLQERWLDPEAEYATTPNPYNSSSKSKRFFPFSQGQRNCIGRGLAQMNYAATVAKLYSHFTFKLADDVWPLAFYCMVELSCSNDRHIWMILKVPDMCASVMGQMGDLNAIWQREWMNLTR
jgi:Cytochrome P450